MAGFASIAQLFDHTAVAADLPFSQVLGHPLAAVLTGTDWGSCWLRAWGTAPPHHGDPRGSLSRSTIDGRRAGRRVRTRGVGRDPRRWSAPVPQPHESWGRDPGDPPRPRSVPTSRLLRRGGMGWGPVAPRAESRRASGPSRPEVRRTALAALVPRFSLLASGCVSLACTSRAPTTPGRRCWCCRPCLPRMAAPCSSNWRWSFPAGPRRAEPALGAPAPGTGGHGEPLAAPGGHGRGPPYSRDPGGGGSPHQPGAARQVLVQRG